MACSRAGAGHINTALLTNRTLFLVEDPAALRSTGHAAIPRRHPATAKFAMAKTNDPVTTTAVLIVGGGPVGLALAADLGYRNIPCILAERRDGSVRLPKMNMVSGRTMEFCRKWGIAGEVRRLSIAEDYPRTIFFATSANGYELARFDYPSRQDSAPAHSPECLQRCSQLSFDPLLRDYAASRPAVTIRHLTAVQRFEQDADGVTVWLEDMNSGAVERVARAIPGRLRRRREHGARAARHLPGRRSRAQPFRQHLFHHARAGSADAARAHHHAVAGRRQWLLGWPGLGRRRRAMAARRDRRRAVARP